MLPDISGSSARRQASWIGDVTWVDRRPLKSNDVCGPVTAVLVAVPGASCGRTRADSGTRSNAIQSAA